MLTIWRWLSRTSLLAKGAIQEVKPQDDQFTSTLFLVQKENGNYRPVISLRALNQFWGKESFMMEGLQVVKSLIQQGDFMLKLDLKDVYYALPIHAYHRKYRRFIYEGRTCQFQCLPFGLSSAPQAFTKTLKPVLAVLWSMGIQVVIYIDDMLLLHQQSKVQQKIFAQVVDPLEKLGFLVKREKCSPIPCQRLIFLTAVLDSTTMTLFLPRLKLTFIVDTCHHLLAQGSGSRRTLSTLIGQMRHASHAFPENPKICVVRSLTAYVERTKGLRKSTELLESFISPHKAISSQSVSWWLSRALRMAGIELNYTGHSARGAST